MTTDPDALKQEAAERAAAYLTDGMVIGLGTGSTTDFFLRAVGARAQAGLRISGVPTSTRSEARARELGIPVTTLDANPRLALAVDGADEVVLSSFDAVKGRGGALLREKLVALAADVFIIIIDESKLAAHIGEHGAIPVEVVPFGWQSTAARLAALGGAWRLRGAAPDDPPGAADHAFVTDGGNFILDCQWPAIPDPGALAAAIKGVTGVVDHGLFIGLAGRVIVAGAAGVQVYERPSPCG
jgi:ribose 5-phosphate isomerase A